MWNCLLVVTLTMLLFIVYLIHNRDFVNASFFIISGFLLSSIFSLLNLNIWGLSVGALTFFVIISGLICFIIGDLFGSSIRLRVRIRTVPKKQRITDYIDIKLSTVVLCSIFMSIINYYYFRFIYRLSLIRGNREGIAGMFRYARILIVDANYDTSLPILLGQGKVACECLGFLFLFIYLYNLISHKKIITIYIIPCVLSIINNAISTARINFLRYIIAGVIMALIILGKKDYKFKRFRFKTLIISVTGFVILLWGFRMLGYLTGKSTVRSLWTDISVYIGSSIPSLDYYLCTPYKPNEFFGKETLANVYKILRVVKLTSIPAYNTPLPFIRLGNGRDTNVYTAFRRLIQDYGFVAMYLIFLAEGVFYGIFTKYVKGKREVGLSTIIFAYMLYPVFFSCIDEQFILNFTAVNLLYHIFYFYVTYRLILKKSIIIGETIEE